MGITQYMGVESDSDPNTGDPPGVVPDQPHRKEAYGLIA
jgi:hypothetical protein